MNPTDGAQFPVAETTAPAAVPMARVYPALESAPADTQSMPPVAPLVDGISPALVPGEPSPTVQPDQSSQVAESGTAVLPEQVHVDTLPQLPTQAAAYEEVAVGTQEGVIAPPEPAIPSINPVAEELTPVAPLGEVPAAPLPEMAPQPVPASSAPLPPQIAAAEPVADSLPALPVAPQPKVARPKTTRATDLRDVEQVDALVRTNPKDAWTVLETKLLGAQARREQ